MTPSVSRAREFALAAHADQRYGPHPYSHHLDAVVRILEPFGETAQIVGYLHDVLEDTAVPFDRLAREFGATVAEMVRYVTDEPGTDRPQRKRLTHDKLARCNVPASLIVKAADRLANLRMCVDSERIDKLSMYRSEHPDFRQAVYRPGLCDSIWSEIDSIIETA